MSSRLFNEVREKRGLAYSVSSGLKSLNDTGGFMVRAGVDNSKIVDALDLILKVLGSVAGRGVKADEFKRAQEYYMGQFLLGLEDTMDYMLWMGGAVISHDQVKTMSDVIKKIKAVTRSDIKRVAAEILDPKRAKCRHHRSHERRPAETLAGFGIVKDFLWLRIYHINLCWVPAKYMCPEKFIRISACRSVRLNFPTLLIITVSTLPIHRSGFMIPLVRTLTRR